MNALQDTVDRLWKQLAEEEILLEQQKKEEKEKQSWEFNMGVLENIYKNKRQIAEDRIKELERKKKKLGLWPKYSKERRIGEIDRNITYRRKTYEQDAALYHLFKHFYERLNQFDERLNQLVSNNKKNYTKLDDRLTHIEQSLYSCPNTRFNFLEMNKDRLNENRKCYTLKMERLRAKARRRTELETLKRENE